MYKGAIFFDYDGTLIDKFEGITQETPKTLEALAMAQKNGYLTALCSGRGIPHLPKLHFNFDCYVTANGSCVSTGDGSIIFTSRLPLSVTTAILDYCNQRGFGSYVELPDICMLSEAARDDMLEAAKTFSIDESSFCRLDESRLKEALKMVVLVNKPEQISDIEKTFGADIDVFTQLNPRGFDIAKKNISKATGIEAVIKHYGIAHENTYAFGDGGNDYGMISYVRHGIVMEKHDPILDGVGEYVTSSVAGEGIYNGMKRYGLI